MTSDTLTTSINKIALWLAAALFVALGLFWWRERTRHYEAPRWPLESSVSLKQAMPELPKERWIVAVNPECAHCMARLAELKRRSAAWTADRSLGVLVVDTKARPDSLFAGANLDAGVWWDSLGEWRSRWGHRVYGETMVFERGGTLVRVLAPSEDPDAALH